MKATKTFELLYPALHFGYDEGFTTIMKPLLGVHPTFIINMYLGDIAEIEMPYSIFILFDKTATTKFDSLLNYFIKHLSYVYDYSVDNNLHMIILQLPQEYFGTYDMFIKSKYSKMYSKSFLNKYGKILGADRTGIFTKNPDSKYAKYWKERLAVDELDEYDSALKMEDEMFSKKKYYEEIRDKRFNTAE